MITRDLIERAIKHFPKWMDIRKRSSSSIGGQLIETVAEETELIQEEINEFVKEHFINHYEDKCEEIVDFVYKANVGYIDIDTDTFSIIDPNIEITTVLNKFYSEENLACYQEGFIFIREELDKIIYEFNGYTSEAILEKIHVWNIYDEFATFVGIKRYEQETNRELFNRIISVAKNVSNSSEKGIKNAIISNLINIVPELNFEDIKLERPTAKNLVESYDEFNTILDKLTEINKDVLKSKSWDIDKWSNDFKEIDYIPHTWDIPLSEYTNGIGDREDLKPIFIDGSVSTDLELSFYKKDEVKIDSYIRDKDIDGEFTLNLMKYNNVLNSYNANYLIKASEVEEIHIEMDSSNIGVDLYKTLKSKHVRTIGELISNSESLNDIEIVKEGELEEGKYYRVKFSPKNKYASMDILNCLLVDENGMITSDEYGNLNDFRYEKGNFGFRGNYLSNNLIKKSVTMLDEYDIKENAVDTGSGVSIDNISQDANLSLDVTGLSGESLKFFYDCELSNVPDSDILLNNFFYNNEKGVYMPDITNEEKSITIKIRANQFSMKVTSGHCIVNATVGSFYEELQEENGIYKTKISQEPKDMVIEIATLFNNSVEISEFLYSNFLMEITSDSGTLIKNQEEDDLYWVPQGYDNKINIKMRARTQYPPILRRIFIGTPLELDDSYETDLIIGKANTYLKIDSNCNVELYESSEAFATGDKNDLSQTVTKGFRTNEIYRATSNDAYIILDTSNYIEIENIYIEQGTYENTENGVLKNHIIRLKSGQEISTITITGHYDALIASKTIQDLIKAEDINFSPYTTNEDGLWIDGCRIFANKLKGCFIIEDTFGEQRTVNISIRSFNLPPDETISKVVVYGLPASLQAAFTVTNDSNNHLTIGNVHEGIFSNFYIYPKNAKEYIAINEYRTYASNRSGIDIVNTFNNGYQPGQFMIYEIESMNEDCDVMFDNGKSWTVGELGVTIKVNKGNDFNFTKKVITESIKLGSTIGLKDIYVAENKELIELSQYVINTENQDYEVIYKQDVNNTSYDRAEFINIKNDGFNKLQHSNIVDIKYLGREVINEEDEDIYEIDEALYEIDKERGIITWKDQELINSGEKLYIIYSIKKAVAIKFKIDKLYKKVNYSVGAYKKIGSYEISNVESGRKINLASPLIGDIELSKKISADYKESNVTFAECSTPGFISEKEGDILITKKVAPTSSLGIKSGWYYLLGREYYMFSTNQSQNIVEDEHMTSQGISKDQGELIFHKKTSNFIKNSKMILSGLSNSYNVEDFNEIKSFKGASNINKITACDSYNYWNTFAMNLSFTKGLNGLGLYFNPMSRYDVSYALLDITEYVSERTHISFYNPNKLAVYLGREKVIRDIPLTDTITIGTMAEIRDKEEDIYYTSFNKENNYKYYLIVRGQGLLDDIIIQDGDQVNIELHKKNISNLNLDIYETITSGITKRILIESQKGNKNNGTEINADKYIVNTSNVDWNVTKIKEYKTERDWLTGWELDDVNVVTINDKDSAIVSENSNGKIVTRPIYIGDPKTINSIIYKINDVPIESMTGTEAYLTQAQTSNGNYLSCKQALNNSAAMNYARDLMYPYIKLSVDIAKNKVINNIEIYIEYKSSEQFAPLEKITENGEYITKVLDSYDTATYKLKTIEIEDMQGDIKLSIRASKEGAGLSVWTNWHDIELDGNKVINNLEFEDYRFFQIKAKLGGKESKIKINNFDLEVIK